MVLGVSTRRSTPNHIDRVRGSIPLATIISSS
jgi:hypothetical protein